MKNSLCLIVVSLFLATSYSFSQDFLEVKYSVNDIKKQRENFVKEKIKSVTVNNTSKYEIDKEGKIVKMISEEFGHFEKIYNYSNNNLISISAPADMDIEFKYDINGNIIEASDMAATGTYYYDINNRLIKTQIFMEGEEGEGNCGPERISYKDNLVTEELYPCCMGFLDRIVYEYFESSKIAKVTKYTKNCSSNMETVLGVEIYHYENDSMFPYKISSMFNNQSSERLIKYEYYD